MSPQVENPLGLQEARPEALPFNMVEVISSENLPESHNRDACLTIHILRDVVSPLQNRRVLLFGLSL
jgi:hypothetical protein